VQLCNSDNAIDFVMSDRSQGLAEYFGTGKIAPSERFIKVHMERITGAMLMRDPDLMPRDVAILLVLIGEMDHKSGRIDLCASELARKCEIRQSTMALSLSRLKKKLLVIPRRDPDSKAYFMLINPDFASVGAGPARAIAAKRFKEEWIDSLIEETGGSRQRALDVWTSLIESQYGKQEQEEAEAAREEELADLMAEADPRLQELLIDRKVFKPMSDKTFKSKMRKAEKDNIRTVA